MWERQENLLLAHYIKVSICFHRRDFSSSLAGTGVSLHSFWAPGRHRQGCLGCPRKCVVGIGDQDWQTWGNRQMGHFSRIPRFCAAGGAGDSLHSLVGLRAAESKERGFQTCSLCYLSPARWWDHFRHFMIVLGFYLILAQSFLISYITSLFHLFIISIGILNF